MGKEKWPGGYVRRNQRGAVFVIEREIHGERYHLSTRAHSLRAAMAQLERFEANPRAYRAEGESDAAPVRLTPELVAQWRTWALSRGRTQRHVSYQVGYLGDWAEDLRGRDLRSLRLADYKAAAELRKSRQQRIAAIKAFCTWLRTERGLLMAADDATVDLRVPQSTPEKSKRWKAVRLEHVDAALRHMDALTRACLVFLARTGWHVTELERFAQSPDSTAVRNQLGAVVIVVHKSGENHATQLLEGEGGIEAAELILEARRIPCRLGDAFKEACRKAGVPPFTPGQLRHSVATWAHEMGASAEDMRRFFGWKDYRTGQRFYIHVGAAPTPVPLPRLKLTP